MNSSNEVRDEGLSFSEFGSGLPVIFLHPTPVDREFWLPVVSRMHGVRAILPDLRGHGQSPFGAGLPTGGFAQVPDAPVLSMEQLATDVLALMDRLQLPQAVFVGCSIGGYVLLELWRRAPERMRALAFICSKPQPDAAANAEKRAASIAKARAGGASALFDGVAKTLIGESARQTPEIVRELRARMTVTPEALVAVQAGLATRPDSVPDVATLRVPVLAVAGGEDPGVTPDEMRVFKNAPGGCTFHLLLDAGHFAAYEQPERVAEFLSDWLSRLE